MGVEFNADEIFEMAEQIERNGAKFYRRAAELAKDENIRKELSGLADWELRHEKIFAAMRTDLSGKDKLSTAFDPNGEAGQYLQAMADRRVFDVKADPSAKLNGNEPIGDVLKIAIGLEKDSIAFYTGIKAMVPKKLGEEKIDAILREEMTHISLLRKKLDILGA